MRIRTYYMYSLASSKTAVVSGLDETDCACAAAAGPSRLLAGPSGRVMRPGTRASVSKSSSGREETAVGVYDNMACANSLMNFRVVRYL